MFRKNQKNYNSEFWAMVNQVSEIFYNNHLHCYHKFSNIGKDVWRVKFFAVTTEWKSKYDTGTQIRKTVRMWKNLSIVKSVKETSCDLYAYLKH